MTEMTPVPSSSSLIPPPIPGSRDSGGGKEEPIKPIIPKDGVLCYEEEPFFILCKPKLLPIKSVTIEKMEKLQREAQEKAMAQMNGVIQS